MTKFPIPKKTIKVLNSTRISVNAIVLAPLFISLVLCLFQILLLSFDTKKNLKELYKGKCEFVMSKEIVKNPTVASGSFHFAGFVKINKIIFFFFSIFDMFCFYYL